MARTRRISTILVAAVATLAGGVADASAAPGDIGTEDFSYAPLGGSPTQTKPESKAWYADGAWWATLFSPAAGEHRIHRLTGATWTDTGTTIDARNSANADVLWHAASGRLYVATHVFSEVNTAGDAGDEARLYRFSYDAAADRYTLDPGFPAAINRARSESLVIDMDSAGRLWATWPQDGRIYVNRTVGADASWGAPFVVPGSTPVDGDDLSSLVAFGGDRIGVMWSNQLDDRFWFSVHQDAAGDGTAGWTTAPIGAVPELSDDHVSLRADAAGRVFAAVKTSETGLGDPLVLLLRRSANGAWSRATYGIGGESHTRPTVVLQEPGARAHVMATCPQPPATSGQGGGDICLKSTSLSSLGFARGLGEPIIRDAGSPEMNDATSTKQSVNSQTGLLTLANIDTLDTYWHSLRPLTGAAPAPVTAEFTAGPTTGDAPLTVRFTDASAGGPTSRSWSFGDFGASTARNPSHTYTRPGTYTVSLTVAGVTTGSTRTKTALVRVTGTGPPEPGGGSTTPPAPRPPVATPPGRGVAGTTAQGRRVRVRILKRNLSRGRVRIYGSVSPRLNGVRVVLLRRSSTGRWSTLRTVRLRSLNRSRSRFTFVVKRLSKTVGYRVVVPAAGSRTRAQSSSLKVKRRS